MLQCAYDRVVGSLQNSNNAPFFQRSLIFAAFWRFTTDSCDYAITVQGCASVFRGDEQISFAWFFRNQKSVAGLMNLQNAGNKIGLRRQDVTAFANPGDLARAL